MSCPDCGAPMQQLFSSLACSAECDLKPTGKGRLASPLEYFLSHKAVRVRAFARTADRLDAFYWGLDHYWWYKNRYDEWCCDGPAPESVVRNWWANNGNDRKEWEACDPPLSCQL